MEKDTIEQYKKHLCFERQLKKKTVDAYLNNITQVEKYIDLIAVKHRSEIVSAIEKVQTTNNWNPKASTTWRCSRDIVYFYKWAVMERIIEYNPYPFNAFRKPQYNKVDFITESQFKAVASNEMHLTHQDKLILWVFWDTALRREELRLLDRENFDLENGVIFLPEEKSKGAYGQRHVAMSETTIKLVKKQFQLLDLAGVTPHVFCGDNYRRINPDEIYKRMIRAGKMCPKGYIKLCPRAMRHSLAVRLLEAGATDLEVQMTLGHANKEMSRRYAHSVTSFAKGVREKYLQTA